MRRDGILRPIVTAAVLLSLAATGVDAQTTTRRIYDEHGRSIGRAEVRPDGSARYYGATGRETGRSEVRSDGSTRFYDEHGRQTGTVR